MIQLEKKYMRRAIELAIKGAGYTSPNPMVGAVLVKEERIIGEGYHRKYGESHAEPNAIDDCIKRGESPKGSILYVTLEPCCHYGKQPPCTERIIKEGIKTVVIGSRDPNPLVAGKGCKKLREAGIEVVEDYLREECDNTNKIFFHYITKKEPYVIMKYAMTADGKIAAYTGKSKWITGPDARRHVHVTRHKCKGIMVGIGTVLADDPMLNCRIENPEKEGINDGLVDPIRIVCDSNLRIPLESKIVKTAKNIPAIIATCISKNDKTAAKKIKNLEDAGCMILKVSKRNGHIDLQELMKKLAQMKIDSILLEGGGTINWAMIEEGLVNCVNAYIAPKILGGKDSLTPIEGIGFENPECSMVLDNVRVISMGNDILIEGDIKRK